MGEVLAVGLLLLIIAVIVNGGATPASQRQKWAAAMAGVSFILITAAVVYACWIVYSPFTVHVGITGR